MTTPAKRRTDPERARNRRNQVLEAAAVCFARSGFHGASMSEISKQAGMSAGHIYNYFDSKDAIILAFVEREGEHITGLLRDLGTRDDPLQAMIDDAPRYINETLDPQPWQLSLDMYAEASRNPVIAAKLRVHDESSRAHLRALVKSGRERRNLPVDDEMLDGRVDTVIAYFQGLPIRQLHRGEMNRSGLADAFRISMTALLLT